MSHCFCFQRGRCAFIERWHIPDNVLGLVQTCFNSSLWSWHHYSHFIDEETEPMGGSPASPWQARDSSSLLNPKPMFFFFFFFAASNCSPKSREESGRRRDNETWQSGFSVEVSTPPRQSLTFYFLWEEDDQIEVSYKSHSHKSLLSSEFRFGFEPQGSISVVQWVGLGNREKVASVLKRSVTLCTPPSQLQLSL